jgi:hypothetical protein
MTDDAESTPPPNPIEEQDRLDEPPPTGDGVDEGVQDTIAGPAGPRAPASD